MIKRIISFLRKNEKIVIIICTLAVFLLPLMMHAFHEWIDLGIDILVKPQEYTSHDSAYSYDGYLNLVSNKSKFSESYSFTFTINTAFCEVLDDAMLTEYVRVHVIHSDYLEVEVSGASERIQLENQLNVDLPPYNDVDATYKIKDFEPAELVYQPVGLFRRITRESLPYEITITVKIKDDAPEEFSDELWIGTSIGQPREKVGECTSCRVCVKIQRDGDEIKIVPYTGLPRT